MKIFIGTVTTETNTFATAPTGLGAFAIQRESGGGDSMTRMWPAIFEPLAKADGHKVICGLLADAAPDGPIVRSVYEALRDELLSDLSAAMPVGAVILPLHGAMVAEGYPDCEGDILERVRRIVGPDVAIGVELDLHCHFTDRMRRNADIIVAYKEYPHTDIAARFEEVWNLTLAVAERRIHPVTAVHDCRMSGHWHTTRAPMKAFVQRMKDLEGKDGVLSVNFGHGFDWGDVPEAGAKVWVVTDGDRPRAAALAEQLGREIWDMRYETQSKPLSLDDALDQIQKSQSDKPLVLADIADNAGGGASSDSTFILAALLQRRIGNVAIGAFWDLGALQICQDVGLGATLDLRVGGKCGPASGDPVDVRVTIQALCSGPCDKHPDFPSDMYGSAAWVRTDTGIDLVLVAVRQQVYRVEVFTGLGIDLGNKRAIVVKSSQHFHATFAPIASDILYVDTPGLLRADIASIPYEVRDRNFWPRVSDPWSPDREGSAP